MTDFGQAITAIKNGKMARRSEWNGSGMFIFLRPADELNVEFVVDKVKSLPQGVKDYYLQDILDKNGIRIPFDETDRVKFTAYVCLKDVDGSIVNGWAPTQLDMLCEDWEIIG